MSSCTYVRLAVKITQLLKDKFCANIPGKINILIPLTVGFFFPFVVFFFSPSWTTLSRNALPSSFLVPHLHKHISSISLLITDKKKFHYPRNRMSPDFNPTRMGRNVIPLKETTLFISCPSANEMQTPPRDPCKPQCHGQAADTEPALYELLVCPVQISGL